MGLRSTSENILLARISFNCAANTSAVHSGGSHGVKRVALHVLLCQQTLSLRAEQLRGIIVSGQMCIGCNHNAQLTEERLHTT